MNMKRLVAITTGLLLGRFVVSSLWAAATEPLEVSSPDGNLTISFALKENPPPYAAGQRAYYRVSYKGKTILNDSPLGLTLAGAKPLDRDFEVASIRSDSRTTTRGRTASGRNGTCPITTTS